MASASDAFEARMHSYATLMSMQSIYKSAYSVDGLNVNRVILREFTHKAERAMEGWARLFRVEAELKFKAENPESEVSY